MSDLPDHVDVVVVGAGLAGLRAARVVGATGRSVLVCEASDGVGGRARTDVVDGFLVDRGFQILNTSYPALRAALDLDALDLHPFLPGAAVRGPDGALHTYADPRRAPSLAPATATDRLLPLAAKARIAALTARTILTPPQRQAAAPERSTAEELAARGLDGPATERFLRPFLAGVLGDRDLETSSRVFSLFWRSFALGDLTLPARGIGAVGTQLAARLPAGALALNTRVTGTPTGVVDTDRGRVKAGAVIVATEGGDAAALLGPDHLPPPRRFALTSHFHVTDEPPTRRPLLHLDGAGGPIVNTMVLTAAVPSYSPDHRHLVASTVLGPEPLPDAELHRELDRIWGTRTDRWEHLTTVRVPHALPATTPPTPAGLRRPVEVGNGVFVAGDHRDTPSTQGALVSGRRAAKAALAHLR